MKRITPRFTAGLAFLALTACVSPGGKPATYTPDQLAQIAAAQRVLRAYADFVGTADYADAAALFASNGKYRESNQWHVAQGPTEVQTRLSHVGPSEQPAGGNPIGFDGTGVILHGESGAARYRVVVAPGPDGVWRITLIDWVVQVSDLHYGDNGAPPQPSVGTDGTFH